MPLVGETSDEMYGMVLWKFLLSMDIPSIHGWKADIHGWQDPWVECNILHNIVLHKVILTDSK